MAFVKLLSNRALSHAKMGKRGLVSIPEVLLRRKWTYCMAQSSSATSKLLHRKLLPCSPYHHNFLQERRVSVQVEYPVPDYGNVFRHDENLNAVRLLKNLPVYKNLLFRSDELIQESHLHLPMTNSSVTKPVGSWRTSVTDFMTAAVSSQELKFPVTHPKNQAAVQALLKELPQLTDEELCQVLYYMRLFAPCPSVKDPAYMSVWKEMDKECNARRSSWSVDFCFVVADLWYGMNLARYSAFHWSLLKKLFRKCDKLSKEHLVRFMFCLNLNRDMPDNVSAYEMEYSVNKICHQLSPEEVVIIGMAFFKTQTPIRDSELLKKLLLIFMESSSTADSVSVSAIAKLARYSSDYRSAEIIGDFQRKFIPELPRLSITACTHLALTGTSCLSPDKELIKLVVERVQNNVRDARLKELERLSLAMTMFNADCDQLANKIAEDLQSPERADEIRKYGRCLPAILHYLSFRDVFIPDLMSMCLSKAFRDTYYGKGKEALQRELLCLDVAADLELEDYSGKRLDSKSFSIIMKKNMLRLRPPHKQKVPVYDQFLRDVTDAVLAIMKDRRLFHVCGILPQHHTMAVVFCRDSDGKFVPVPTSFAELESHEIKKIESNSSINYHAILLCGRNMYLYKSKELCGQANLQLRQTKKLGYNLHLVYFCDWETFETPEQRINHIKSVAYDYPN